MSRRLLHNINRLFTAALSVCVWTICILSSCGRHSGEYSAMQQLDDSCLQVAISGNNPKCDSIANILLDKAEKADADKYKGRALFYLGLFNFQPNDCPNRYAKLQKSLEFAEKCKDDTLQCRIYNMLGVYEMTYFKRYYKAQQFFSQSMKLGRDMKSKKLEMAAESNLSEVYRILQDTMGIRYDREIFDYARGAGNKKLMSVAAIHCAFYAAKHGTADDMAQYLKVLEGNPQYASRLETIKAEFYLRNGNLETAEQHAKKAISIDQDYENILIVYARILNKEHKYKESNDILQLAEKKYSEEQHDYNWIDIYKLYADNYHALGNDSKAFSNLSKYDVLKDSVSAKIHQEQININRVKYEVDKQNQEIERQRLVNRQQLIVTSAVILLLLIIFIAYYLYARRYKRFARDIVRQHQEAIANEVMLKQRLEQKPKADGAKDNTTKQTAISDAKLDDIFERIRVEMEDNEIFCDPTITRDTFSERVGCSHTYLTYAIKAKTGMSYSQFMNNYRIRKAVEILSDSKQNLPLKELSKKLGFIAVSTFYSAFQHQVGISPASYRKAVFEMKDEASVSV